MVYATGIKSSYGQNVYETGIQGVGVRVKIWGRYAVNPLPLPIWTLYENDNVMSGPITLELIKTGPVSGGIMPNGVLIRENLGAGYGSPLSPSITNTIVQSSTCSVSTKNIQVKLDDVIAAEMENVGSTYNPKNFTVGLNCDLGARVSATLTGTKNTDTNADGVLKISNAGSNGVADGVGIQILYNNVPMPLNKLLSLKTFTNEIENIPFTAQYYQTKSTVTMGSVNATATLDITYQ
jgi:type 1 fimbria pilin